MKLGSRYGVYVAVRKPKGEEVENVRFVEDVRFRMWERMQISRRAAALNDIEFQ